MGRTGVVVSIVGVLAVSSAGCAGARMSAAQTAVPVLVGPVTCIGCPAGAPADAAGGPRVADNTNAWGGVLLVPFIGDTELHAGKPPQIDRKVGAVIPDPCIAEMRVFRLAAKSIGIGAILVWSTENRVEVEAVAVPVAPDACRGGPAPAAFPGPGAGGAP